MQDPFYDIEDELVLPGTAKALKKLGFNECCGHYSDVNGEIQKINEPKAFWSRNQDVHINSDIFSLFFRRKKLGEMFTIPTQSVALRWMRDRYSYFIQTPYSNSENKLFEIVIIDLEESDAEQGSFVSGIDFQPLGFYTPEESIEFSINWIINNLIDENGNKKRRLAV